MGPLPEVWFNVTEAFQATYTAMDRARLVALAHKRPDVSWVLERALGGWPARTLLHFADGPLFTPPLHHETLESLYWVDVQRAVLTLRGGLPQAGESPDGWVDDDPRPSGWVPILEAALQYRMSGTALPLIRMRTDAELAEQVASAADPDRVSLEELGLWLHRHAGVRSFSPSARVLSWPDTRSHLVLTEPHALHALDGARAILQLGSMPSDTLLEAELDASTYRALLAVLASMQACRGRIADEQARTEQHEQLYSMLQVIFDGQATGPEYADVIRELLTATTRQLAASLPAGALGGRYQPGFVS